MVWDLKDRQFDKNYDSNCLLENITSPTFENLADGVDSKSSSGKWNLFQMLWIKVLLYHMMWFIWPMQHRLCYLNISYRLYDSLNHKGLWIWGEHNNSFNSCWYSATSLLTKIGSRVVTSWLVISTTITWITTIWPISTIWSISTILTISISSGFTIIHVLVIIVRVIWNHLIVVTVAMLETDIRISRITKWKWILRICLNTAIVIYVTSLLHDIINFLKFNFYKHSLCCIGAKNTVKSLCVMAPQCCSVTFSGLCTASNTLLLKLTVTNPLYSLN